MEKVITNKKKTPSLDAKLSIIYGGRTETIDLAKEDLDSIRKIFEDIQNGFKTRWALEDYERQRATMDESRQNYDSFDH